MGFLDDLGNAVGKAAGDLAKAAEEAAKKAAEAAAAPVKAAADIVQGKPVDKALQDAVAAQVAQGGAVADLGATAAALQNTVAQKVAAGIAGPGATGIVADLQRLAQPVDDNTAAAVLHATEQFVKTGDPNSLQPAAVLMAAEVSRCRNLLYPLATPIAAEVVGSLPDEFRAVCEGVHVMPQSAVPGDLNAPSIAIRHLENASAMTLVDVIVFNEVPGHKSEADQFLWVHELQHVRQYRERGVAQFCQEFMGEELGFRAKGSSVNFLEADADYAACRHYPAAKPAYIEACPI